MKKSQKSDEQFEYRNKKEEEDNSSKNNKKDKMEVFKCGQQNCGKFYHSYTAFYNHCKKSHGGEFPENSLHNNKLFEGPCKNRGRPRIRKNQTKDETQIQSMKRQNQLIQFLGTLKTKKAQELIVYVENPIDRLESSTSIVEEWLNKSGDKNSNKFKYLKQLQIFNKLVASNDLPEFYDPVESELYKDNLDSYNFSSIYRFMISPEKRERFNITLENMSLMNSILVVWLARILSEKLLSEVIFTVMQIEFDASHIREKELLVGKTDKFKEIADKYYTCFLQDEEQEKI